MKSVSRSFLLLSIVPLLAGAAEAEPEAAPPAATAAPTPSARHAAEENEDDEWQHHRDSFTFFGGATIAFPLGASTASEGEGGKTESGVEVAPTVGVDYSYRVSKYFGLGVYVDFAAGPIREATAGPLVLFHPVGGLFIEFAPSIQGSSQKEAVFLGRFAFGYEFDVRSWLTLGLYVAGDLSMREAAVVPGAIAAILF